jgi:DNA-binding transcriptional ArsR family regulator
MFTEMFGEAPRVRLLDFLADHPDFDYTISQMAEFAKVARPTVYKLVTDLQSQGLLSFTRSVGASKFYRLNLANPRIVSLLQMDFEGINKELADGIYDDSRASTERPAKSQPPTGARGRRYHRDPSVRVRAYPTRTVRKKRPKSSD